MLLTVTCNNKLSLFIDVVVCFPLLSYLYHSMAYRYLTFVVKQKKMLVCMAVYISNKKVIVFSNYFYVNLD